jgi:chemotaxis protein methyltransferase CheR
LDKLCRNTISRFYRDRHAFAYLGRQVLSALIQRTVSDGDNTLRCWSAGCVSGEEAYTLILLWNLMVRQDYPDIELQVTATNIDPTLLIRATRACYGWSSLRKLPDDWRARAFMQTNNDYCLKPEFRSAVNFLVQDIRQTASNGLFHLVLCRNLVFTYFAVEQQRDILKRIETRLLPGGALVIGVYESLPEGVSGFCPWLPEMPSYRYSKFPWKTSN